jgi:hypothetical protein
MRRSICVCEPSFATAGESKTWKFIYTPSIDLPKGTSFVFDLLSSPKPGDWQIPDINPKSKSNLIWATAAEGKPIYARLHQTNSFASPQFEFLLPAQLKAGEHFTLFIGSPLASSKTCNQSQTYVQRRRSFKLSIDTKVKGQVLEPEIFHMDVRGNLLKTLKIIVPSFVTRNRRFDVVIRFEDIYGNLTSNAPEGTLIELTYENLRENLYWKLFIPETGFITLPNLYFNEPGIYRIQLKNLSTKELFFSPPMKCFSESEDSLFWGVLHGESERFDARDNIENFLRQCRDEKAMQFISTSPFDSEEETSNDQWKHICTQIAEINEEERFITFLGFQWAGTSKEEGLRQFLYTKDLKPLLRKKDIKHNSLKKIYKIYQPKDLLSIPSFTMGSEIPFDFKDYNSEFERVAEIYNSWGSSECTEKEGNLFPIRKSPKKSDENAEGSFRNALNHNCRFGFVAGGLDDRGSYSSFYSSDQVQYPPGLTAIIATTQTREALLEALYNRHCYATTGERMVIDLHVAQAPMGSELNTEKRPGLSYSRHLSGYVIGTDKIQKVEIIRNGKLFTTYEPEGNSYEFAVDDTDPLSTIALNGGNEKPPFVYYYLRVLQKNGSMAWSSPIWIDCIEDKNSKKPKKKA